MLHQQFFPLFLSLPKSHSFDLVKPCTLSHLKVLLKGPSQLKNQVFLPLLIHKMTKLNHKDKVISLSALFILTGIEQGLVLDSKTCLDVWCFSLHPLCVMLPYPAHVLTSTIP